VGLKKQLAQTMFLRFSMTLMAGCSLIFGSSTAQNSIGGDPELLNIAGKPITKSEFMTVYMKNNTKAQATDPKSVEDYMELFINFKLKVKAAEDLGMDTISTFKNELEGYRKQLAQPYLVDNEVTDQLLKEAYERMKTDIHASHILIKCESNALPKDSLAAYNKAIDARKRLLKGEPFAKVAKAISDDPSAKENGGDLGFFSSLQMVYPFESAAYNTEQGKISMPVRTRFGYHVIQVLEKRKNPGTMVAAHIMVKCAQGASSEDSLKSRKKIDEIMGKLKAGEKFAELARQFSDDKGSAKRGGELPAFGTGRMVPEFEKAAFALPADSAVSEIIKTQYGWHIIKRISRKELASYDEMKAEIKSKVTKDSRSQKSKDSKLAAIKKDYGFKETLPARDEITALVDTTFFEGKWQSEKARALKKNLFSIGEKNYTQSDFVKFLETRQTKRPKIDITQLVRDQYSIFLNESLLSYEESKLASKYPDYKALLQEYRDGILLFDLTDKNVWSKAVKDTVGLKAFYEANKNKYMWDSRVQASIYKCSDEKVAADVRKKLSDKKKSLTDEELRKEINKDSQLALEIESGKFLKGENEWVDKNGWKPGIGSNLQKEKQIIIVKVDKVINPEPKSLQEAKGAITADYQSQLEKDWISELRTRYPVVVNRELLKSIK
jgi:peptidyl-prolyl cis-trans isomerase SurA